MDQRKVVRYDNDPYEGDKLELSGKDGHGTKVAGVILGHNDISGDGDDADGVAPGAKLHVYDIKKGSGTYLIPHNILCTIPCRMRCGQAIFLKNVIHHFTSTKFLICPISYHPSLQK